MWPKSQIEIDIYKLILHMSWLENHSDNVASFQKFPRKYRPKFFQSSWISSHLSAHGDRPDEPGDVDLGLVEPLGQSDSELHKRVSSLWTQIHAVCFKWDTVKFLISMSQNFTSDFDINVPLLSHILYLVFTHTSHKIILLYILLYCVSFYMDTISIPSNS